MAKTTRASVRPRRAGPGTAWRIRRKGPNHGSHIDSPARMFVSDESSPCGTSKLASLLTSPCRFCFVSLQRVIPSSVCRAQPRHVAEPAFLSANKGTRMEKSKS